MPAVPPRVRRRRHLRRGVPEGGEARLHRYLDHLPTSGNEGGQAFRDVEMEEKTPQGGAEVRLRRAVRRQVFRPRRAGRPPAAPRRLLPGRHGRFLLGGPQHQGQDQQGRHLARGAGTQPGTVHPGEIPREARARRGQDRPQPADERDPGRAHQVSGHDAALAHRHASSSGATSPTRSSRSGSTRARGCRSTSRTTRSTTPARPRPPRACRRARSARRPPGAWIPTSICSSPTAARWS